jgi:hypothetical protein
VVSARRDPGEAATVLHFDNVMDFGDMTRDEIRRRGAVYFAWCVGFYLVALVIGLLPAILVLMIGYMRFQAKESWRMTLAVSLSVWIFSYLLFHRIIHAAWPEALLGDWFPTLRWSQYFNLV